MADENLNINVHHQDDGKGRSPNGTPDASKGRDAAEEKAAFQREIQEIMAAISGGADTPIFGGASLGGGGSGSGGGGSVPPGSPPDAPGPPEGPNFGRFGGALIPYVAGALQGSGGGALASQAGGSLIQYANIMASGMPGGGGGTALVAGGGGQALYGPGLAAIEGLGMTAGAAATAVGVFSLAITTATYFLNEVFDGLASQWREVSATYQLAQAEQRTSLLQTKISEEPYIRDEVQMVTEAQTEVYTELLEYARNALQIISPILVGLLYSTKIIILIARSALVPLIVIGEVATLILQPILSIARYFSLIGPSADSAHPLSTEAAQVLAGLRNTPLTPHTSGRPPKPIPLSPYPRP